MALALELAQRIASLRYADVPDEVVHWAKVGVIDTVGVTLAGNGHADPAVAILERVLPPSPGKALVFGSRRRVSALDAALINGTASHALDFDDCNNTFCGHPSVPILPGLFALADQEGASAQDFLTAYVAGFEAECKLAMAAGLHQYTHGWHPTATLGVFGAAAASARLMQLDATRIATALAIAASLASGIKANLGTMTKPLHVGHCARNGLFAAMLAREGFTANVEVFEHPHGYFEVFNGAGHYDVSRVLAAWGAPYDLARPGLAIKQYPCCGSTHPALDAMLELVRTHKPPPDDVARVDAWIHRRRLEHTNRATPASALDAKFSLQYCLARALVDGAIRMQHFEGESYSDAAVAKLLPRIHVAPYTTDQFPVENHFAGAVRITLTDGRVLDASVDQALGRTVDRPLPEPLLRAKFEDCALRALQARAVGSLYAMLSSLETLSDVRDVSRALEAAALPHETSGMALA